MGRIHVLMQFSRGPDAKPLKPGAPIPVTRQPHSVLIAQRKGVAEPPY